MNSGVMSEAQLVVAKKLILNYIVSEALPFSQVESPSFRRLLKFLCSAEINMSRRTCQRQLLSCYSKLREKIGPPLSTKATTVSLTVDLWTSKNHRSFLGVTLHFINSCFQPKSILADIVEVKSPYTGEAIAEAITSTCDSYCLSVKSVTLDEVVADLLLPVLSVTSDNASNMINALSRFEVFHRRCVAHVLNLIYKASIVHFENCFIKIKNFTDELHGSTSFTEKFFKIQEDAHQDARIIPQNVKTRWNSDYLMVITYLKLKLS
ncbi:hypothetical protein GEMRC1_011210 [Eukaryota sp. GEM-RC1]